MQATCRLRTALVLRAANLITRHPAVLKPIILPEQRSSDSPFFLSFRCLLNKIRPVCAKPLPAGAVLCNSSRLVFVFIFNMKTNKRMSLVKVVEASGVTMIDASPCSPPLPRAAPKEATAHACTAYPPQAPSACLIALPYKAIPAGASGRTELGRGRGAIFLQWHPHGKI